MYKTLSIAINRPGMRIIVSLGMLFSVVLVLMMKGVPLFYFDLNIWNSVSVALVLVLAMMPLNLYCESRKWQSLMNSDAVGFTLSFKQVLAGLCAGFITPNRIGELAGRLYRMPPDLLGRGGAMALAGSAVQGNITLAFGLVGIMVFPMIPEWKMFSSVMVSPLLLLLMALTFACAVVWFVPYFRRKSIIAWKELRSLELYTIMNAYKWGILRYLVFSLQFIIVLHALGCNLSIFHCFAGVSLLYFCQSFVPGAAFGEIGFRETFAVVIFGATMPGALLPAAATLFIWLANIVIPVALTSIFLGYAQRNVA